MSISAHKKIVSRLTICMATGSLFAACGGNSQDSANTPQLLAGSSATEACVAEWNKDISYLVGQKVTYRDFNYVALKASTDVAPRKSTGPGQTWSTGVACGAIVTTSTAVSTTSTTTATTKTTSASSTTTTVTSTTTTTSKPVGNIKVSTAAQLISALAAAKAGDVIELSPGKYEGQFVAKTSGVRGNPITLTGPASAVLSYRNYGFSLMANYWKLTGFTVANSDKGIVLDGGNHNLLDGLHVHSIRYEAVHFRTNSSNNVIQNSHIENTGSSSDLAGVPWTTDEAKPKFGEGVYIGSDPGNLNNDKSLNNCVANNKFGPYVRAEGIDVKESTTGALIFGNTFDMTGVSGDNSADSAIDVKGSSNLIYGNTVTNPNKNPILNNGFEAHEHSSGWGGHNIFQANHIDLQGSGDSKGGFGYWQQDSLAGAGNVFCTDNVVVNAPSGPSSITPTACAPRAQPACSAVLNN